MGRRYTKIIIETEEVVVARLVEKPILAWCPVCKAETQKVTAIQAALLCEVDRSVIQKRIHSQQLHVSETPAGDLLICLRSLGQYC